MNTSTLTSNLSSLKSKLQAIESNLEHGMLEIEQSEDKWKKIDKEAEEFLKNEHDVIRLNVGGKRFSTKIGTLLSIKDTFFYKIVVSKKFDLQEELFFDRNPKIFSIIIDYLRIRTINYSNYSRQQLEDLFIEAEYFDVQIV